MEELKKTAVADVKKSIDWLGRFSFSGDMRKRFEGIYQTRGPKVDAKEGGIHDPCSFDPSLSDVCACQQEGVLLAFARSDCHGQ